MEDNLVHRCEGWEWAGRDGEDDISDILVTVDPAVPRGSLHEHKE